MAVSGEITILLSEMAAGNGAAVARLMPLVYAELRQVARAYMRREKPGHTLQATALVHEAYLRLLTQRERTFENRAHFYGIAARLMRQILVDHARKRQAQKRGGRARPADPEDAAVVGAEPPPFLLDLDAALERLAARSPRQCRVAELRYFTGLSEEETAEALGVSPRTVKRDWQVAKVWLYLELNRTP